METKTLKLQVIENWLTEPFDEFNYSHRKYFNWVGIVTRNGNGENQYNWMKPSKNSDEYFNVSPVKVGDILYVGSKNTYKSHQIESAYYGVVAKDENSIELVRDTTYLKVKKRLMEVNEK